MIRKQFKNRTFNNGFYRPKVNTFNCLPYEHQNEAYKYMEQGIQFTNGVCKVGCDVWRSLDPHDTISHPFEMYSSIEDVNKKYIVFMYRKEMTICLN